LLNSISFQLLSLVNWTVRVVIILSKFCKLWLLLLIA
jgi:hypothetical protein